ncbi:hypothetical protein PIROE2DRAFT_58300 [Piromyces sp. E2]|nr:hypothetical protein PIROE2DRAFT_58300 [Piromyces sp. E2]|eukprot:OUM68122.1 hypothetical protein PIROE2DRAFT_58300 [Piromyces sp. E2]
MVNVSTNNQYITYEEFRKFAQNFIEKSKQLNYKWEWIENLNNKNKKGFLKLFQYSEINKDKLYSQEPEKEKDEIIDKIISNHELNEFESQFEDDHPILGVPYYYIHPCTTGQNMNMLYDTRKEEKQLANSLEEVELLDDTENTHNDLTNSDKYYNYIASWLSTTGFLKVDFNYFL